MPRQAEPRRCHSGSAARSEMRSSSHADRRPAAAPRPLAPAHSVALWPPRPKQAPIAERRRAWQSARSASAATAAPSGRSGCSAPTHRLRVRAPKRISVVAWCPVSTSIPIGASPVARAALSAVSMRRGNEHEFDRELRGIGVLSIDGIRPIHLVAVERSLRDRFRTQERPQGRLARLPAAQRAFSAHARQGDEAEDDVANLLAAFIACARRATPASSPAASARHSLVPRSRIRSRTVSRSTSRSEASAGAEDAPLRPSGNIETSCLSHHWKKACIDRSFSGARYVDVAGASFCSADLLHFCAHFASWFHRRSSARRQVAATCVRPPLAWQSSPEPVFCCCRSQPSRARHIVGELQTCHVFGGSVTECCIVPADPLK